MRRITIRRLSKAIIVAALLIVGVGILTACNPVPGSGPYNSRDPSTPSLGGSWVIRCYSGGDKVYQIEVTKVRTNRGSIVGYQGRKKVFRSTGGNCIAEHGYG